MAVSFSAEYLYQGAKILSRNPFPNMAEENAFQCPAALFALARAVYSLGIFAIAPIGMLYHGCAAGVHYGRTFFTEERNVAPLNQLAQQHWEACGYDGIAFLTSCTVLTVAVGVAMGVTFGISDPDVIYPIILCIICPWGGVLNGEPVGNVFLQIGYAQSAAHFVNFLPREQQQIYSVYYIYNKLMRAGIVIDAPLSAQEIADFNIPNMARSPIDAAANLYQQLLQWNKVTPAYQARLQAFVERAPEMRRAWEPEMRRVWEDVLQEARGRPEDERWAFIAGNMGERMRPILAALPPIGVPAPAAQGAAAQA